MKSRARYYRYQCRRTRFPPEPVHSCTLIELLLVVELYYYDTVVLLILLTVVPRALVLTVLLLWYVIQYNIQALHTTMPFCAKI